jgi:hypothetical protein
MQHSKRIDGTPKHKDVHPTFLLVSGAPRSGTTLFQQILNTHPQVGCTHELNFDRLSQVLEILLEGSVSKEHLERRLDANSLTLRDRVDSAGANPDSADPRFLIVDHTRQLRKRALSQADIERPTPHPVRADAPLIAQAIWSALLAKPDIRVIADKTPNIARTAPTLSRLADLGLETKIMIVVRNPFDTINSSMARRNRTLANKDNWHIENVEGAIAEWNENWTHTVKHFSNPKYIYFKYEDIVKRFDTEIERLSGFLELPNMFRNICVPLPDSARGHALDCDEKRRVLEVFGDLDRDWHKFDLKTLITRHGGVTQSVPTDTEILAGGVNDACAGWAGFSEPEAGWRWSAGQEATLRFQVRPTDAAAVGALEIRYFCYPQVDCCTNWILSINGGPEILISPPKSEEMPELISEFPIHSPAADGKYCLRFRFPIRKNAGQHPIHDNRELSLAICGITIKRAIHVNETPNLPHRSI